MDEVFHVTATEAVLFAEPAETAEPLNTLLYGEAVHASKDPALEWLPVRALHDDYQGYIHRAALGPHEEKTHIVNVPATRLYDAPDFKRLARGLLYFGALIAAEEDKEQNGFIPMKNGLWAFRGHLRTIQETRRDFVDTALMFLYAPYQWGGRSMMGLDCSGLVQIALMASGITCPRDTGPQSEALGTPLNAESMQRGDLVFFDRHVGIMLDGNRILNATARYMTTLIEPLDSVVQEYNGIKTARRL